jgi:hypothetical protein
MSSYVPGNPTPLNALDIIELRVISELLQSQSGMIAGTEDLKQLRNDQAFDLGIVPPVVPGN